METETYKKAKEILEKFDPSRFKKLEVRRLLILHVVMNNTVVLIYYVCVNVFHFNMQKRRVLHRGYVLSNVAHISTGLDEIAFFNGYTSAVEWFE